MSLHWFFANFYFYSFFYDSIAPGVLSDRWCALFTAATVSFFSHISTADFADLGCILYEKGCLWVFQCIIYWFRVSPGFYWQRGLQFLSFAPCFFCLRCVLSRTGIVCSARYRSMLLGSLLNILVCVVCPMIPSPLGDPVSRGIPVSVVVCYVGCFLPALPVVLFSIYWLFLVHDTHPSYRIEFHLWRGFQ